MKDLDNLTSTSKEIIGVLIETRRKSKKITQQELATLLQVDRQYIWKLENGKVNLTMNYLDKVIKVSSNVYSSSDSVSDSENWISFSSALASEAFFSLP
jgi:transcriptional regulator with XRE-family HTH domain